MSIAVYLLVVLLTLLASMKGGGRAGQVPISVNYHFFQVCNKGVCSTSTLLHVTY